MGIVAAAAVGIVVLVVLAALAWGAFDGETAGEPNIVVGTPGGVVAFLTPTPDPTPVPTPRPSPEPTVEPTPISTPVPTHSPAATPEPTRPPPAATPPQTPAPTPIVVAVAGPADSVAAFYGDVAAGRFDAAYALWSDRMRATYSRQENLDERFDQTSSITFEQLSVIDQGTTTATVQANFVETYDSGSSRRFIGYWELILVDGRWLLDAPHY